MTGNLSGNTGIRAVTEMKKNEKQKNRRYVEMYRRFFYLTCKINQPYIGLRPLITRSSTMTTAITSST